jgi:hypothetical protein
MDNDYTDSGFDKLLSRAGSQTIPGPLDQETPNRSLPFDRTPIGGSTGDTYRVGNVFIDGVNGQIFVNDTNNKRVILGTQTDGTPGLTVSKEGKDADINRPQDLFFNSNQNVLKVAKTGTYTFPSLPSVTASATVYRTATIPHNLGVVPGFLLYLQVNNAGNASEVQFPPTYYKQIFDSSFFAFNNITDSYYSGVNDRNLYISRGAFNGSGGALDAPQATVRYYILQESITV